MKQEIIVLGIIVVLILFLPTTSAQTVEHTASTTTVCDDAGTCTKTLYSGVKNVFDNGTWKSVDEMHSLKGIWEEFFLEVDGNFSINVIDFNSTDIELDLNFTGNASYFPDECDYKSEEEAKCQFKVQYKEDGVDIKFDYKWAMKNGEITENTYKFSYKGDIFGKNFKFGGNSTTLQLRENVTEVMEEQQLSVKYSSFSGERAFQYKINITSLPSSITDITEAKFCVTWGGASGGGASRYANVSRLENHTWISGEDVTYYNETPLTNSTTNNWTGGEFISTGAERCINVTDGVEWDFDKKNLNTSFRIEEANSQISFRMNSTEDLTPSANVITYGNTTQFSDFKDKDKTSTPMFLNITYTLVKPFWHANGSTATGQYTPILYEFNTSWNMTGAVGMDSVLIEHNFTGTSLNYSMNNLSYGNELYNYTYIALPVGWHQWRTYGNSTDGSFNATDIYKFEITRNSTNPIHINISLAGLNFTDTNINAESDDTILAFCYQDYPSSGTSVMILDEIIRLNPLSTTLGAGVHTYLCNTSGNINYTNNTAGTSVTATITVPSGPAAPGGGGGGAVFSPVCGDNVCTHPENNDTCALDCGSLQFSLDVDRFDFSGLPGTELLCPFSEFESGCSVCVINNLNTELEVNVQIQRLDDISSEWANIIVDNRQRKQTLLTLPPLGTECINLRVLIPEDTPFNDYLFQIWFDANNRRIILPFQISINTFGAMFAGVLDFLINQGIPIGVEGFVIPWLIVIVLAIVLSILALIIKGSFNTRRKSR